MKFSRSKLWGYTVPVQGGLGWLHQSPSWILIVGNIFHQLLSKIFPSMRLCLLFLPPGNLVLLKPDLFFYDSWITQKIWYQLKCWPASCPTHLLQNIWRTERLGLRALSVSSFGLDIVPRLLTVMICVLGQILGVSIRNDKQQPNDLSGDVSEGCFEY